MTQSKSDRIVALLPMKANSSRVPGKNFRDFCGRPLFYWILSSLLDVSEIDQIIVNTDARDLLSKYDIMDNERILIRDRKPEICGDDVSMNLVLADDVMSIDAGLYLMTHTTNPLLKSSTIVDAIERFSSFAQNIDSIFSVTKYQSRFYSQQGDPINHDPTNLIPTQDLTPWYEENSNFYLFTRDSFLASNARIGKSPYLYEVPMLEAIDIDTQEDWDLAVAVASKYYLR